MHFCKPPCLHNPAAHKDGSERDAAISRDQVKACKADAQGRAWKSSSVELDLETQTFMPRACRRARTSAAGTAGSENATMPHSVRPASCRRQPGTPALTQHFRSSEMLSYGADARAI